MKGKKKFLGRSFFNLKPQLVKEIFDFVFQKARRFENQLDRFLATSTGKRIIKFILFSLIIISILRVFVIVVGHNPNFEYDEANGLQISRRSIADIRKILSYEQNFPLYYRLLHYLMLVFGNNGLVGVWSNFMIWLFSVYIFYHLLRIFFSSKRLVCFGVLIYILTPNLAYYAFTVRMYSLYNLVFLISLYAFLSYISQRKIVWLVIVGYSFLFLSLLHPSAIILLLVFFFIGLLTITKKRDFLLFSSFVILAIVLLLTQLAPKSKEVLVERTYIPRALNYLWETKTHFFEFPALLLFFYGNWEIDQLGAERAWLFVFFILSLSFFYKFRKKDFLSQRKYLVILCFLMAFCCLPLLTSNFLSKHLIFLISPYLLVFFVGLSLFPRRQLKYLAVLVFFIFSLFTSFWVNKIYSQRDYYQRLCQNLNSLERGVILVSLGLHSPINHCRNLENLPMLMFFSNKVKDISEDKTLDILIYKAKQGGQNFNNWSVSSRRGFEFALKSEAGVKMKQMIKEKTKNENQVYFIMEHPQGQIDPNQFNLLGKDFRFEKFLDPDISVFIKNEKLEKTL
ncbi:hypothetical protein ACFLZP_02775 [Patescibacteria group bacterium]